MSDRTVAELDAVIEQALRDGDLAHEHPEPGRWLLDLPGTKKLKTVCGLIVGEHASSCGRSCCSTTRACTASPTPSTAWATST
jgi:hypothetical protein